MPQRETIVEVLRVTDCDTGIYEQNELDFRVPVVACDWLDAKEGRRLAVAKFLRWLADQCEQSTPPFNSLPAAKKLREE